MPTDTASLVKQLNALRSRRAELQTELDEIDQIFTSLRAEVFSMPAADDIASRRAFLLSVMADKPKMRTDLLALMLDAGFHVSRGTVNNDLTYLTNQGQVINTQQGYVATKANTP